MKRRTPVSKRAPRKRYRFTKKDCQRGYRAALEKCSQDWDLFAWLFRRVRGHYRKKEDRDDAP